MGDWLNAFTCLPRIGGRSGAKRAKLFLGGFCQQSDDGLDEIDRSSSKDISAFVRRVNMLQSKLLKEKCRGVHLNFQRPVALR